MNQATESGGAVIEHVGLYVHPTARTANTWLLMVKSGHRGMGHKIHADSYDVEAVEARAAAAELLAKLYGLTVEADAFRFAGAGFTLRMNEGSKKDGRSAAAIESGGAS